MFSDPHCRYMGLKCESGFNEIGMSTDIRQNVIQLNIIFICFCRWQNPGEDNNIRLLQC